ncbi:MAG TPA: asparagine synthase (glutamine-hydrolyzing) [Chloroflexota bacterium]|jgi:asparagine synthase (glutamine-hydrolysing)|nr:asparagine synthase (glutamine-hydrolyzing) [Chloroflexota bacterium]
MCGIAGTLTLDSEGAAPPLDPGTGVATPATLKGMAAQIAHRGPDAEGFLLESPAALASRRLAIIDLSDAGRQPLFNEDGSIGLVYNGELYNFQALRRTLIERGHRFRSATDSEVVVHAYEEFGPHCVRHFNGMFAFAIWDRRRRQLFLARDRFGVKPLYYTRLDGVLAIASEIKAFLALPSFRVEVDAEAMMEYFTFQNIFSDRTLFKGVHLLPSGTTLTVGADGAARSERYWTFNFYADADRGEQYYVDGVRERFEEAVRRQLMSDVPVGCYLSGGMDSGSICAVASRQIPHLHTFTGGFHVGDVTGDEVFADERGAAEAMAVAMGTEHYQRLTQPHDMSRVMPRLIWHLEDLRVGSSYHNFDVARLASRFVTVVLAGTGGDELFAGYPWRYAHAAGAGDLGAFARRYAAYWSILVPDAGKADFFAGTFAALARGFAAAEVVGDVLAGAAEGDPLNLALSFEARTYLQGLFLVEDKLSMAHSLESRVPFLDNDLVDFACAIPSHHKLRDGTSKYVLRRAMRGLIPDHILGARKQGFAPPEDAWYRRHALPYLRQILLSPRSLERGYFQPAAVHRTLEEHVAGTRNHKKLLWSLLCFEWWNRIFVDGDRPTNVPPSLMGSKGVRA